ncbi:MAG TPA: hypothetical protein VM938_07240 [Acidimicrobiales bacterium]|nr:hypothetical protein [Acidimicrobiales bacterium]
MELDWTRLLAGRARRLRRYVARGLRATTLGLVVVLMTAAPTWADDVKVEPTATGLAFGDKIQRWLNWGGQFALWACLASIIAGGGAWGLSKHFGSYGGANKGMQLVLGGAIGALVVASAGPIVNSMFNG